MKKYANYSKLALCVALEVLAMAAALVAVFFIFAAELAAEWEKQDEQR